MNQFVQEHEPGWLGGELNGKIGWFPEAYAQRLGEGGTNAALQPIQEVSETGSDNGSLQVGFPLILLLSVLPSVSTAL